jgi:hypothetical protein
MGAPARAMLTAQFTRTQAIDAWTQILQRPGINVVSAGILHFLVVNQVGRFARPERSRPPETERISVVTPLRRRYETAHAGPFQHVGMRGNPVFPQLHSEP